MSHQTLVCIGVILVGSMLTLVLVTEVVGYRMRFWNPNFIGEKKKTPSLTLISITIWDLVLRLFWVILSD